MRILGIETSCDETAVSVVEGGTRVLSNAVASSMAEQARFGGVVPEVAARRQVECITPVIDRGMRDAGCGMRDIDAIAVTKGPGLLTSLLVGVMAARVLESVWRKPLIGVHHTLGHLSSPWLTEERCDVQYGMETGEQTSNEPVFPVLALSVSGGHTELWFRESHTRGTLLGRTIDDAAGEAFDKGATLLRLPYPGGPALSRLAEEGNPRFAEFGHRNSEFGRKSMDFSFSGLKTALKYALRDRGGIDALSDDEIKDIAASYQEAICDHLVSRIERALELHPDAREVHLVGGVAANGRLRAMLRERIPHAARRGPAAPGRVLRIPHPAHCTDNAAMVAAAGFFMVEEMGNAAYAAFKTEASIRL